MSRSSAMSVLILSLALGSCSAPASPLPAAPAAQSLAATSTLKGLIVRLSAVDCRISGPTQLATGSTSITLVNDTPTNANFEVLALDSAGSFDGLIQHVAAERARLAAGQDLVGPPGYVSEVGRLLLEKGQTGHLEISLSDGVHAVVCAQLGEDKVVGGPFAAGPITVK